MTLDPQARAVIELVGSLGLEQLSDLPYDQLRAVTLEMSRQQVGDPVAEVRDLVVAGPAGEIPVRLYRPAGSAPSDTLGVLVWFHGGGWVIGSVEGSDGTCRSLANRSGAAVVSVEYRLAPEHRFPAAVEDCWAATGWVADHAGQLGVDPSRVAVGGDSAGGNLAAVVALMARDAGGPALAHQVLVYPAVDARMGTASIVENAEGYLLTRADMAWFYDHYLGGRTDAVADWRLSPILHERHDGLPAAIVITAGYDPLRDEGEAYAEKLRQAGVAVRHTRYDGEIHGFFGMLGQIDAAEQANDEVAAALTDAFTMGATR